MQPKAARMFSAGIVLAALAAFAVGVVPAHANGNPLTITLSYLDGVSNWGPTSAAGVAEMVGKEGELRLVANGLPLLGGEQYEVWIMNTSRGDRMALGRFAAGADGIGKLDLILDDPIPDKQWNLMMISIEPDAALGSNPSSRHSIAGRFPAASAGNRPGELPRTGGDPAPSAAGPVLDAGDVALSTGAVLAVGAMGFTVAGVMLGRWMSRARVKRASEVPGLSAAKSGAEDSRRKSA